MNLRNKRRMTASILGVGLDRVWFDSNKMKEIKDAITKDDLRKLISDGSILVKQKKGVSRFRARKLLLQRKKGRSSGPGSKKGKLTSRLGRKESWVNRIRAQRELFLWLLDRNAVTRKTYRHLRIKSKGGVFKSRRHVKLYLTEHNLWSGKK